MLLFASCIKVDGTIKIEDDGSGTVDFLTALNTEVLTSVLGDFEIPESELGSSDELCAGFESEFGDPADVPDGATVTPYNEDGFCGSRVEYPLPASTDHSAAISDVFDDTARLYKEGDNWFFETGFDVDDITAEADGAPQAMMDALFGESSFRISIDLPGRAVEGQNNATTVGNDGQFTWDIDILNPPARLFAQTEPGSGGGAGGGGLNPLAIVAIVALLAALGFGVFWFLKNRGGTDAAVAGAGAMPAPGPLGADAAMPAASTSDSMPLMDGPPIAATPPGVGTPVTPAPIVPTADAAKETVIMSSQDLIDASNASLGDGAASMGDAVSETADAAADSVADAAQAATDPVYDEALGAWVVDDPARGRLAHDPATDTWNPV